MPAPDSTWLIDVSLASSRLGYIVGHVGTVLRWNGTNWSKETSIPANVTLRGVAVARTTGQPMGWAVGDGGTILQLENGIWSPSVNPTANDLFDVAIVSANEA